MTVDSKREQILKHIATLLADADGIDGRVYRSDPESIDRDNSPCILLRWTSEQAEQGTVPMSHRLMTVQVDILVRGDEPDGLADPIAQSAHTLLTSDTSLGGLALDVRLGDAQFDYTNADQVAGKLTHEYQVQYRHSYSDLTT